MSAMWAMRRSAESRVRESSEGGRIGPDLDLAPLFYSPPSAGSKGASPSRPCHATLPRSSPLPPLRVAFAGRAKRKRGAGANEGGEERDPRTNRRLFTVLFSHYPLAFLPGPLVALLFFFFEKGLDLINTTVLQPAP